LVYILLVILQAMRLMLKRSAYVDAEDDNGRMAAHEAEQNDI
jgi:hypothetical protein